MTAWGDLLGGIAARLAGHGEAAGFLPQLTDLLNTSAETPPSPSEKLPVQRFWPAAGAGDPLGAPMAAWELALGSAWRQNPNYRADPPSSGFLDNYGYLECAGPEAPVRVAGLRLGLLLLGPGTLYPPHHHPAEEIYLPLSPGRWWRAGEEWCEQPAGAVIHHPPMCGHAMESGSAPLAAIYLWRGEIVTAARIARV